MGAKNPVAGDDERDGVVPHGTADGLGRQAWDATLMGEDAGDVAVCHGATVRDGEQDLPNPFSERRATHR